MYIYIYTQNCINMNISPVYANPQDQQKRQLPYYGSPQTSNSVPLSQELNANVPPQNQLFSQQNFTIASPQLINPGMQKLPPTIPLTTTFENEIDTSNPSENLQNKQSSINQNNLVNQMSDVDLMSQQVTSNTKCLPPVANINGNDKNNHIEGKSDADIATLQSTNLYNTKSSSDSQHQMQNKTVELSPANLPVQQPLETKPLASLHNRMPSPTMESTQKNLVDEMSSIDLNESAQSLETENNTEFPDKINKDVDNPTEDKAEADTATLMASTIRTTQNSFDSRHQLPNRLTGLSQSSKDFPTQSISSSVSQSQMAMTTIPSQQPANNFEGLSSLGNNFPTSSTPLMTQQHNRMSGPPSQQPQNSFTGNHPLTKSISTTSASSLINQQQFSMSGPPSHQSVSSLGGISSIGQNLPASGTPSVLNQQSMSGPLLHQSSNSFGGLPPPGNNFTSSTASPLISQQQSMSGFYVPPNRFGGPAPLGNNLPPTSAPPMMSQHQTRISGSFPQQESLNKFGGPPLPGNNFPPTSAPPMMNQQQTRMSGSPLQESPNKFGGLPLPGSNFPPTSAPPMMNQQQTRMSGTSSLQEPANKFGGLTPMGNNFTAYSAPPMMNQHQLSMSGPSLQQELSNKYGVLPQPGNNFSVSSAPPMMSQQQSSLSGPSSLQEPSNKYGGLSPLGNNFAVSTAPTVVNQQQSIMSTPSHQESLNKFGGPPLPGNNFPPRTAPAMMNQQQSIMSGPSSQQESLNKYGGPPLPGSNFPPTSGTLVMNQQEIKTSGASSVQKPPNKFGIPTPPGNNFSTSSAPLLMGQQQSSMSAPSSQQESSNKFGEPPLPGNNFSPISAPPMMNQQQTKMSGPSSLQEPSNKFGDLQQPGNNFGASSAAPMMSQAQSSMSGPLQQEISNKYGGQALSGSNFAVSSAPSLINQQQPNVGGVPSQQHSFNRFGGLLPPPGMNAPTSSAANLITQQNSRVSGPALPGQPLQQRQPMLIQNQSMNRPPLPGLQPLQQRPSVPIANPSMQSQMGVQQNMSTPPLASSLSGPVGLPPPAMGSQQYPQPNQNLMSGAYQQPPIPNQYPGSSALPGQASTVDQYGMSKQPDPLYSQRYAQQNQPASHHMYGNQGGLYHGGMAPGPGMQQTQQPRGLDPDQMPSPITVIQEDQRLRGGDFITNQRGLVPPLVTTNFTVYDQGNASPRFIRSSIYSVPTNADILKQTSVPFSLIVSPMAEINKGEYAPPIVNMGDMGPVRCGRCKAYMSPLMQFIDAGRKFQCSLCKVVTDVPQEYFQHLDHTGQRIDRHERPELVLGTYEFLATKEYCPNGILPKPPAFIFIIDVCYNTIKSGLVKLICSEMKSILRNLPVDSDETSSKVRVGFITYSSSVHFYNIKSNLTQPKMMVVGDVNDIFMPLLDGFLCDSVESESVIDCLMNQIPTIFAETKETDAILGPAIQAGLNALRESGCAGKLMVFQSGLPTADVPGKLKLRDDPKVLGTDREKSVLGPQANFYSMLGQECVNAGCSVDLFIFNNAYADIATLGQVCRFTGGTLYKYSYFQAHIDGERLIKDIKNNISRPIAFDAVMRIRTSTGVRPTDFYGHFNMTNTTDIELASIDCSKAIAVEIKHDDKLSEDEGVFIQAAMLYTSCSGVRRIRVINLSLKASSQMAELYRSCDLDAIMNFLLKQSTFKLIETSPRVVKDNLVSRCINMLAAYRKHCATPSSAGQLILPECMKLLPLYINCLLKSDEIAGGAAITVDQKSYVLMAAATMSIYESVFHVYPRLLPVHEVDVSESLELPPLLRCSIDKFEDSGAYLLENGIHMFLWLGSALSSEWIQSVFGVKSVTEIDVDRMKIPVLENSLNQRIRSIIEQIQNERCHTVRVTIIRQRDKPEMFMRQYLVEDRGVDGSNSYIEFLCNMHREIRNLLN